MGRPIAPERVEVFAQQHAAHRFQVEADEVPEAAPVRRRPVAAAPQQQPARLGQPRRPAPLLQLLTLARPMAMFLAGVAAGVVLGAALGWRGLAVLVAVGIALTCRLSPAPPTAAS